jgi:hypothetical protein
MAFCLLQFCIRMMFLVLLCVWLQQCSYWPYLAALRKADNPYCDLLDTLFGAEGAA